MRRHFLLLIVLIASTSTLLSAQSAGPQQPGPANNYGIPPAPKPGHPLDPNDVAILTGKADNYSAPAPQSYAQPQIYYSVPVGESQFSQTSTGSVFRWGNAGSWSWGTNCGGFSNSCYDRRPVRRYYGGYENYGYSHFNGSQFADVSTSPFHLGATRRPGGSPGFFFGNTSPGAGFSGWRPHYWGGSRFAGSTAPMFSPGLRP